jgi:hypothetical protein
VYTSGAAARSSRARVVQFAVAADSPSTAVDVVPVTNCVSFTCACGLVMLEKQKVCVRGCVCFSIWSDKQLACSARMCVGVTAGAIVVGDHVRSILVHVVSRTHARSASGRRRSCRSGRCRRICATNRSRTGRSQTHVRTMGCASGVDTCVHSAMAQKRAAVRLARAQTIV